jgi:hypothetical protein
VLSERSLTSSTVFAIWFLSLWNDWYQADISEVASYTNQSALWVRIPPRMDLASKNPTGAEL